MILIINEDAKIAVSRSPGDESLHIEIVEGEPVDRDSSKHLYVGYDAPIMISFAPDGLRLSI